MSLNAELGLETTLEVRDVTAAIVTSVGRVANLVEHHTAGEEQNGNDGASAPEIAVGSHGGDVVPKLVDGGGNTQDRDESNRSRENGERSRKGGVRSTGSVPDDPSVDGLGSGFAANMHVRRE